MQEVNLKFTVHKIEDGEYPPQNGFYAVLDAVCYEDMVSVERDYWDSEKRGWKPYPEFKETVMPDVGWKHWSDDFPWETYDEMCL